MQLTMDCQQALTFEIEKSVIPNIFRVLLTNQRKVPLQNGRRIRSSENKRRWIGLQRLVLPLYIFVVKKSAQESKNPYAIVASTFWTLVVNPTIVERTVRVLKGFFEK